MSKQIFLTGIIDGWTAEDFRYAIKNTNDKRIDVYISTFGGSVNKGFEIANLIQGIEAAGKKEIHTHNLSHADSIGTVVLLAAKKENRHIVESSTMFFHDPRFIIFDEVTKEDAEKMAAELELQKNRIADFYVKNIEGLDKDEALELMASESNLTAQKMQELGIVSEVMPALEIAAQRNLISNQNKKQMSLFKKDQPINVLAMDNGSNFLYSGELKEGTELQKAGESVDLEGEHTDSEGNKIVIDKDNKVVSIEAKKAEESDENLIDGIAELIDEKLTALEKKFDDKLENLKNGKSSGEIPKKKTTDLKDVKSTQATARAGVEAKLKEIANKKREKQDA